MIEAFVFFFFFEGHFGSLLSDMRDFGESVSKDNEVESLLTRHQSHPSRRISRLMLQMPWRAKLGSQLHLWPLPDSELTELISTQSNLPYLLCT